MFSDGSPEGRIKDIDGEFPSGSHPYTEDYDYLTDSDLEDESPCPEEAYPGGPKSDGSEVSILQDSDSQVTSATTLEHPSQPSPEPDASEVRNE